MNTFLICLFTTTLVSFSTNAQKEATTPTTESDSFVWKGGDGKYYDVKFTYDGGELDKEILKKVVVAVMVDSKFQLKNKNSYVPKELFIFRDEDGVYMAKSKYLGTNSYGAVGESESYFEFNEKGEVTFLFSR